MATRQHDDAQIPTEFTELDRFLLKKTDQALADGLQLERWCRDPNRKINEFVIDLEGPYALANRTTGYFGDVSISGQTRSLLGVRQEVEFGRATGSNPEEQLKQYVLSAFLPTSHWTYPDGWPGGFTYEQLIYCSADGQLGRYPAEQRKNPQDWTLIGPKYRWSVFTVFIHDFVVKLGPITKHMKEAATLVQHPDFIHVVEKPRKGCKLEVAFGYPFLDYAPIPNNFGFGPGKFNWAVKLFSFLLRDNNEIQCNMEFAAGARPQKVFDFGKNIPDPVYGSAAVLQAITFGLFDARKVHDKMDANMAMQHAKVHQALLEGASKVFQEWARSNC